MGETIAAEGEERNDRAYRLAESAASVDLDRYMAVATIPSVPSEKRSALLALILLHGELRRVPALVSEPFPGLVRLQWWQDQLASNDPGGPEFLEVIRSSGFARESASLIEPFARGFEQPGVPAEGPRSAAVQASALLQRLSARMVGVDDGDLLERAEAVGAAYALSMGGREEDEENARERLAFARRGAKPPRSAMAAFTLARIADHRLAAGRDRRVPLSMPFRLFILSSLCRI
ncbi:MAG: hypothetical protein R3C97_13340 [Geminicoccaceae bacterium]